MAGAAVLSDGFLIRRRVTVVVAAEAPRIVSVTQVVRVSSPSHFEVGEHVTLVDRQERLAGCLDVSGPFAINIWITLPIEAG